MHKDFTTVEPKYLTVSALTKYIKLKLEGDKHLISILLKGEISNFKRHARGHLYFTLKDENAQISAIMFARDAFDLTFSPKEGDHVLVQGKISLYEPSGSYSIQLQKMTLDGIGELYQMYEKLKLELQEKGYFSEERKKKIPLYPSIIGVITSSTGAVIQDIVNTVTRRYPLAEIHLYPTLVQGPGSAEMISKQILYANHIGNADVLIVGRGGGSIEDLWAFNEMPVIDAIYQSKIPIITAIGHETDFTISDFVSDLRAPTPTAAAELATPNRVDLKQKIIDYQTQLNYRISHLMQTRKTELLYLDERLDRLSPTQKLVKYHEDINRLNYDLNRNVQQLMQQNHHQLERLTRLLKSPIDRIDHHLKTREQLHVRLMQAYMHMFSSKTAKFDVERAKLESLNPLAVMDKGFAVISKQKHVITSIKQLNIDDTIELQLKDGSAKANIVAIEEVSHGKEII